MFDDLVADGWCTEVASRLVPLLERSGVAVFDFDDTCIEGDLGDAVFHHAVEAGTLTTTLPDTSDRPSAAQWLSAAQRTLDIAGPQEGYRSSSRPLPDGPSRRSGPTPALYSPMS